MKPGSAAHTFFTTPELASSLFSCLSPHDLTLCIRVCKQWMQHAQPLLWRNFCYGGPRRTPLPPKTTAGLIRNLPHVRTVELALHDYAVLRKLVQGLPQSLQPRDAAIDPCAPCTHLKRLTLEDSSTLDVNIHTVLFHITKVLDHSPHLTHLTIPFAAMAIDDPILASISNLKHLQSLTVYTCSSSSFVGTQTIALLLKACLPLPKLTELSVDLRVSWRGRPESIGYFSDEDVEDSDDEYAEVSDEEDIGVLSLESIIKKAAVARFSQTPTPGKIKSLQLPVAPERSKNPLALPLLKSGLLDLESCTIFSFTKDSQPDDIERIVQEYCPNLKHLRCPDYGSFKDSPLAPAFIRGCSGLQTFAAKGYCEQIHEAAHGSDKWRRIISTLVLHHCDTLEDFELDYSTGVFMSDLRTVLSRCKKLKRYHVTGYYLETRGTYQRGAARTDLMDPLGGDWACTELRELRITLDRTSAQIAKRFYAQIGRLAELEHLIFDANPDPYAIEMEWDCSNDLSLSRGYLSELTGLKGLKSLKVDANLYRNMGHDELVFIQAHCPLLRFISVIGRAR